MLPPWSYCISATQCLGIALAGISAMSSTRTQMFRDGGLVEVLGRGKDEFREGGKRRRP